MNNHDKGQANVDTNTKGDKVEKLVNNLTSTKLD